MAKHTATSGEPFAKVHNDELLREYIESFNPPSQATEFSCDITFSLSDNILPYSIGLRCHWPWPPESVNESMKDVTLEHQGFSGEKIQYLNITLDYGEGTDEKYRHAKKLGELICEVLQEYAQDRIKIKNTPHTFGFYEPKETRLDEISTESMLQMNERDMKNFDTEFPVYQLYHDNHPTFTYGNWHGDQAKFYINGLTLLDRDYNKYAVDFHKSIHRLKRLIESLERNIRRGAKDNEEKRLEKYTKQLVKFKVKLAFTWLTLEKFRVKNKMNKTSAEGMLSNAQKYLDLIETELTTVRNIESTPLAQGFKGVMVYEIESVHHVVHLVRNMLNKTVDRTVETLQGGTSVVSEIFAKKLNIVDIEYRSETTKVDPKTHTFTDFGQIRFKVSQGVVDPRALQWTGNVSFIKDKVVLRF
jgi:hypothetical protein